MGVYGGQEVVAVEVSRNERRASMAVQGDGRGDGGF